MSSQTAFDKLDLLGVDVDAVSNAEAIKFIAAHAAPDQPAIYVTKPYVEFLDHAFGREDLRELINGGALTIPDGVALTWAAAYLYAGKRSTRRFWLTLLQIVLAPGELRWPLPDRAAGINFTWPLLQTAAARHLRVYLVGDPKGSTIDHTAGALRTALPELDIAGTHTGRDSTMPRGHVGNHWLQELGRTIAGAKPDIILVGMGFPLQENVCAYLAGHSKHGVFIGEGGTFDYERFGGRRPKAPAWVSRIGLEWLWRLFLEPGRIGRQLAVPRFIYRIWRVR